MGAGASSLLVEEIDEISGKTKLSADEVRHLYQRFQKLDRARSGKLSQDRLMMIPELAMNPLAPRLALMFQDANFRQFAELLSVFGRNADPVQKSLFLFRVYDVDEDGFVSRGDLIQIMRLLLGEYVSETQINDMCSQVIERADADGDGMISKSEFEAVVDVEHVKKHATVDL